MSKRFWHLLCQHKKKTDEHDLKKLNGLEKRSLIFLNVNLRFGNQLVCVLIFTVFVNFKKNCAFSLQ